MSNKIDAPTAQAYAVPGNNGSYPQGQPYVQAQPYDQNQPYGNQGAVAQPYNGPTAQQAVPSQVTNPTHHIVVVQPGIPGGQPAPHSYCFLAWFSCIFCCWPIGLVAVFQAASVQKHLQRNDFEGAYRASQLAKKLSLLAIMSGLIIMIIVSISQSQEDRDDKDSFSPGQ